jgi:hypothetical protein
MNLVSNPTLNFVSPVIRPPGSDLGALRTRLQP